MTPIRKLEVKFKLPEFPPHDINILTDFDRWIEAAKKRAWLEVYALKYAKKRYERIQDMIELEVFLNGRSFLQWQPRQKSTH